MNSTGKTIFERVIAWSGAIALILLGLLICLSVGLRVTGAVIKGNAEIGEMLIVIVAATAVVTATFADAHPYVHMLVDKFRTSIRIRIGGAIAVIGAGFWATMAYMNGAIAVENARLIEETELLRISVIPFRWIWVACLAAVAVVLSIRAIKTFAARDADRT